MASRWIKPEIYPLLAPVGGVVGLCAFQLIRNITSNPEVRVLKANRAAGVLENFEEGEKYAQHPFRKYLRTETPRGHAKRQQVLFRSKVIMYNECRRRETNQDFLRIHMHGG